MKDNIKQPWIDVGYELFARQGPQGLKVEVIAKIVNKNKSSFYHHFADLNVFTDYLLTHHRERSKYITEQATLCSQMVPDLLNLFVEIKQDLLFNRQLRINRHIPEFKKCFENANKPVENAFLGIWSDALGLSNQKHLSQVILNLIVENFYLQITEENLHFDWLLNYLNDIISTVKSINPINNN